MKITTAVVVAFSLAFLAACDRARPPQTPQTSVSGTGASSQPQSSANSGKEEPSPVQGQVDPKESSQHKDFQRDGK